MRVSDQYSFGINNWVNRFIYQNSLTVLYQKNFYEELIRKDQIIKEYLNKKFADKSNFSVASLTFHLSKALPKHIPLMLSASSPIRDWITFSEKSISRRIYSFRGVSGIDGTLSLACGISSIKKKLVLITGDLSLIHDSNATLISNFQHLGILIILIDNNGGGIFNSIYSKKSVISNFDEIFTMPRYINWNDFAKLHNIKINKCNSIKDLNKLLASKTYEDKNEIVVVKTTSKYENLIKDEIFRELIDKF